MKIKDIRKKSVKDIKKVLEETSKEYFQLKMQVTTGQLPGHRQLRNSRKDVARLKTLIREKSNENE
ncbi:MAG: 50S ribosomal protein L29 [Pseudomonadota bacterium]|nr:50S ribosomal protein L29 [Pseudomonadota bacterium]|tara:strand:- start:10 stop:207 length:198 start_codon:yes stop_codon:yes gene_type:complete